MHHFGCMVDHVQADFVHQGDRSDREAELGGYPVYRLDGNSFLQQTSRLIQVRREYAINPETRAIADDHHRFSHLLAERHRSNRD